MVDIGVQSNEDFSIIDDFPLKPLTDGVDEVVKGLREWQRLFEEAFDRLRAGGRRDPLKNLTRVEQELSKLIDLTSNREQHFAQLIVKAFESQFVEVENYYHSLPHRTRTIEEEYEIIIRELQTKQYDLKKTIVDRMAGNRVWMQSMLETVKEEKRAWEMALIRQRREE